MTKYLAVLLYVFITLIAAQMLVIFFVCIGAAVKKCALFLCSAACSGVYKLISKDPEQ